MNPLEYESGGKKLRDHSKSHQIRQKRGYYQQCGDSIEDHKHIVPVPEKAGVHVSFEKTAGAFVEFQQFVEGEEGEATCHRRAQPDMPVSCPDKHDKRRQGKGAGTCQKDGRQHRDRAILVNKVEITRSGPWNETIMARRMYARVPAVRVAMIQPILGSLACLR